jgi:hypothetical protein
VIGYVARTHKDDRAAVNALFFVIMLLVAQWISIKELRNADIEGGRPLLQIFAGLQLAVARALTEFVHKLFEVGNVAKDM